MSTLSEVQSAGIRTVSSSSVQTSSSTESSALGQDDFMQLMLAQFQNQDPFSPMDNGEFLGQMAQFSTVNGIGEMQTSLEDMLYSLQSNQVLEASALVGKSVLVEASGTTIAAGEGIAGTVELPVSSQSVQLEFVNAAGSVVGRLQLGEQPAGEAEFSWDGTTLDGGQAPAGEYQIQATFFNGDANEAAATSVRAAVESVSFSSGGVGAELTLKGLGSCSLSDVKEIS